MKEFVAASESPTRHWTDEQRGIRVFRMHDELIARTLFDWSEPLQLRCQKNEDGTYDLICRTVDK